MKRAEKARRDAELEAEKQRAAEDDEDRERAVRDFEMTQTGLSTARKQKQEQPQQQTAANGTAPQDESSTAVVHVGSKRKFELDQDELQRIVREDKLKARKAIEDEKVVPTIQHF